MKRLALLLAVLLAACAPRVIVQLHTCTVYTWDDAAHYWTVCKTGEPR